MFLFGFSSSKWGIKRIFLMHLNSLNCYKGYIACVQRSAMESTLRKTASTATLIRTFTDSVTQSSTTTKWKSTICDSAKPNCFSFFLTSRISLRDLPRFSSSASVHQCIFCIVCLFFLLYSTLRVKNLTWPVCDLLSAHDDQNVFFPILTASTAGTKVIWWP